MRIVCAQVIWSSHDVDAALRSLLAAAHQQLAAQQTLSTTSSR